MKHNKRNRSKKLLAYALCFCILCTMGILSEQTIIHAVETIQPSLDMSNAALSQTSVTGYLVPTYTYGSRTQYGNAEFDIALQNPIVLSDNTPGVNLSCKSSNKNVQADASLTKNILHLRVHGTKTCSTKLTVSIGGKNFQITVSLITVKISANSLLVEKGKTKKLKINGCPNKNIKWSSSNKKIASVNKKGVIKAKRIGNAVITAKINGKPVGCAVSVTTRQLQNVCKRATYIGTHWSYSQARRAQEGFYDCSSLVWKAYTQYTGLNFGSSSYPGTSASESAWCRDNNKMISGGYSYRKVEKMQLNPGDLIFKSTNLGNPYNTTYHVEMFTGYTCLGYNSKGKPVVTSLWASRAPGYGAANGSLLARPTR